MSVDMCSSEYTVMPCCCIFLGSMVEHDKLFLHCRAPVPSFLNHLHSMYCSKTADKVVCDAGLDGLHLALRGQRVCCWGALSFSALMQSSMTLGRGYSGAIMWLPEVASDRCTDQHAIAAFL